MGLQLRFTGKKITPWGGMGLIKRMLGHIEFGPALRESGLPQSGSNRGYAPEQLIIQFMLSVWCGANRFEHGEVTRHDPVLRRLFGVDRMANFKAVIRSFRKFTQTENERVMGALYRELYEQPSVDGLTHDPDSTVMTRYGQQDGAPRGYNPNKCGRLSHHPLMAFISDVRMVANCWLHPGNADTANNASAFLESALERLGRRRVALLRADGGFCDAAFLEDVERQTLCYTIALHLNQPLQRFLVDHRDWWQLDEGIELISFEYQASSWSHARRVIGIRQRIKGREQATGKTLSPFADVPWPGQYHFAVLVTDLALPAPEIWSCYRCRADCENRIKELKYDFAADSFCLKYFWATEACLNIVLLAYNLTSRFRQAVLRGSVLQSGGKDAQQTLKTLRYKLFAKAGCLTTEGRKNILKLAVAMRHREWLEGLWERSRTFLLPVHFPPAFGSPSGPLWKIWV